MEPGAEPLHVVALVGDFPAVSKTFVLDQLVGLLDAGHRLTVLAEPPRPGEAPAPGTVPDPVVRRIRYRQPPPSGRAARRTHAARSLLAALRVAPRATASLLADRRLSLGRRRELLDLVPVLHDLGDADVFHAHFGVLGRDLVEVRGHLGLPAPVVTAFHGFDVSRHVERFGPRAFDRLFAEGELLLPVSEHWRERLSALGAPAHKLVVHRMGVDVEQFSRPDRRPDPTGRLRILSVCRLVEKKGLTHGIDAVARLREQGIDAHYRVIGDGPLRVTLEQQVRDRGLDDRVTFLGSRPREQVVASLQAHDVLLCPSVTAADGDTEGIPVVLMEAMATGLPVVASHHSGIPELVEDRRSGLLAPEGDDATLARHLRRLHEDPAFAGALGSAARRRVEEEFDVRRQVRRLSSHLQVVATTGGAAGEHRPRRQRP
ncbi:glycosyltransferase [Egicoccus halophilus]|uniref:Colanic acid biosynthesis glycosyltransferase WcaL n=1 Tax=Egicoccus halophilus TaxID=1670830 RepID=A0A8J3A9K2_9ACTN|nr:glycosyltransferase [Egicoccus halophilus]GGI05490.1 colanic acid biosynthesis glycosyltransferase WcaL [Egicoccus halophilus]